MDLHVNHGSLDTASGDLSTGASNIQSTLDTMDAELKQLMTNWEGDAQQAYLQAKAQWTEGMNGMREVLAKISMLVNDANQNYRASDSRNASRFV